MCDEAAQVYKFSNRSSQKVYDAILADFDERQVSIELLILKGRQLGITTKTALKFLHRMLFIPHTQAIMASVKAEASQLIGRIVDTAYNHCPFWLVPSRTPKKGFDNGSVLSIQSGMQATGLAQGWTPSLVHLSELADIPDPKKTIEEGLFRAAHSSRNLYMVLEGTGGGNTGWLAETWRAAKERFPQGAHRLCPVFISWPMCPEIYPQRDWIRKYPIPGGFHPHEATMRHVRRCEAYIRNTPYLARVMGKDYKMPMEQIWFWQFNYDNAVENHTQKVWASQMPADDHEALTGKHDSVFEQDILDDVENYVYEIKSGDNDKTRKRPMKAYAITGVFIDDAFTPDPERIDYNEEFIRIRWTSPKDEKQTYEWELVPIKLPSEENERDSLDLLLVFEEPKAGVDYACGVDTADGLGKEDEERLCISMTKVGRDDGYDIQVAELTSNRINAAQATFFAAAVAAWYGRETKDWRGVKFAIEQIAGPGDTCQNQLKLMGFNYHHKPRRYDSKKAKDEATKKEGWYSNVWSVPMLMTRFVEAVNGGWYRPQSKWLIEEMKTLERHTTAGKSKLEHREGAYDDRVRAAAQSYFTTHDLDVLASRAQRRYAIPQKNPPMSRSACTTSKVGVGDWD